MNQDRFSERFSTRQIPQAQPSYRGFTTNPLAGLMTEAQVAMYQAAFEEAQREVQQPRWRVVECMN